MASDARHGYVITDLIFGYTGRIFDSDVGLQNNLNRWYDAATGRWLSEDPIGFAAGDANLYRYVGNEVTGATDPSGLIDPNPWRMPEALWDDCCQGENNIPEGMAMNLVMEYLMPFKSFGRLVGGGDGWVRVFRGQAFDDLETFQSGTVRPEMLWLDTEIKKMVRGLAAKNMAGSKGFDFKRRDIASESVFGDTLLGYAIGGAHRVDARHKGTVSWKCLSDGSVNLTYSVETQFDWYDLFDWRGITEWPPEAWTKYGIGWIAIWAEFQLDVINDKIADREFYYKIEYSKSTKKSATIFFDSP